MYQMYTNMDQQTNYVLLFKQIFQRSFIDLSKTNKV